MAEIGGQPEIYAVPHPEVCVVRVVKTSAGVLASRVPTGPRSSLRAQYGTWASGNRDILDDDSDGAGDEGSLLRYLLRHVGEHH